jgi:hypothetical protein
MSGGGQIDKGDFLVELVASVMANPPRMLPERMP